MVSIKAAYKIPDVRHVFLIVDSLDPFLDSSQLSQESKKRKECFERILRSKDRRCPKATQQWTLKIMLEHDFLMAIKQNNPTGQVSANQTYGSPEDLELLAINLVKTPESSLDRTFNTPKVLSLLPDEDIIEVFI